MEHRFKVQGMSCGHCEIAVKKAIARIDPQAVVDIDRDAETVNVDSNQSHDEIANAIRDEGYRVT